MLGLHSVLFTSLQCGIVQNPAVNKSSAYTTFFTVLQGTMWLYLELNKQSLMTVVAQPSSANRPLNPSWFGSCLSKQVV